LLVQPDAWHEVDARGTQVLIAFVDAESELGGAFAEHRQSDVAPVASGTIRNGANSWEILRHCQRLEWSRGSPGRCCEGASRLRSTAG
jgi:hypothetical protein